MSLAKAEKDFVRVVNKIRRLDQLLSAARERATKIAHYIEIAREYELGVQSNETAEPGTVSPSPERASPEGVSAIAERARIRLIREQG